MEPQEDKAIDVDAVLRLARELEAKVEDLEKLEEQAKEEKEFVVV